MPLLLASTSVVAVAATNHNINFGESVVYGIVQGLTEFLPVSSTAHLRIVPALFDWPDPGAAFTAVTQLGTTLAMLLYFWRELFHIGVAWFRGTFIDKSIRSSLECRMGWYLIIATLPVGVIGFIFRHSIETSARNLWLIATMLIVMGLVLLGAERVGERLRDEEQINTTDAVWVGTAQALALIPGASRSGTTIAAGLFRGLDRPTAARFSFLLSIPAVVLSGLFEARHITAKGNAGAGYTGVALILAFVVGLVSIAWLMRWISRHSTYVFIIYRVALGLLLIGLLSGGVVKAT